MSTHDVSRGQQHMRWYGAMYSGHPTTLVEQVCASTIRESVLYMCHMYRCTNKQTTDRSTIILGPSEFCLTNRPPRVLPPIPRLWWVLEWNQNRIGCFRIKTNTIYYNRFVRGDNSRSQFISSRQARWVRDRLILLSLFQFGSTFKINRETRVCWGLLCFISIKKYLRIAIYLTLVLHMWEVQLV